MVEENEDGEAKNDTLNEESTITDIIYMRYQSLMTMNVKK